MGNLKFNGKSTEELGLVIQTPPSYTFPEKDMSSVHIPGRNGDLFIDNKCYKNVDRTYAIAKAFRPGTKLYANAKEILEWLTSANGKYAILEDSYDNEVYRLAMFNMSNTFTNYFDEAASINVTFECKPQRFLKDGEKVIQYIGSKAEIENPTGYYSLPSIELVNVPSEVEDILMMTVLDSNGDDVANITLNHVGQQDPDDVVVVIDSDEQTVVRKYSDRDDNVAAYVGLNGLPFPELRKGKTTIELKKYESEDTGSIESYDSFMYNKSEKVEGLYKPIERIAAEKEKKVLVRSWDTLVAEAKKVNSKSAYQSYALEIAEDYTFASVNDVLDSVGQSTMDFTGALVDCGIDDNTYDFVLIEEYQKADGEWYYKIGAKKPGFFIIKGINDWKTLKYYQPINDEKVYDEVITAYSNNPLLTINQDGLTYTKGGSDTIIPNAKKLYKVFNGNTGELSGYYVFIKDDSSIYANKYFLTQQPIPNVYPNCNIHNLAFDIKRSTVMSITWYPVEYDSQGQPTHNIKINYGEDKPDWLVVNVIQGGEDQHYSPQKVEFKTNASSDGYYYKPKPSGITGIFSKPTWFKNTSSIVLNSMVWDSSQKKFVSTDGIFKKSDVTYNFKYLALIGNNIPQYSPDKDTKEEIYFTISDNGTALSNMNIKAAKDGWYLLTIGDDGDLLDYTFKSAGQSLNVSGSLKGTESFKVSYIPGDSTRPDITYTNEKDWPDWLDPIPLGNDYRPFGIKPAGGKICFKLANNTSELTDKKYMWHTAVEDEPRNVLEFTSPKHINSPNIYVIQNETSEGVFDELKADTDFSFYIYQIKERPTKFDNDRSVIIYNKDGSVVPGSEYAWDDFNELSPISDKYSGFLLIDIEGNEPEPGSDEEDTRKVIYYAKKDGYYKWGTNSAWVYKHADIPSEGHMALAIVTTSIKDDLKIFYTEHLPQYSSEDIPVLSELIELKPQPEETSKGGENPTAVAIKVKDGGRGYYRVNNNVDWKLYNEGDTILVSKVNETNQIFHLKPKSDTLSNMKIKIKPRWWML